ncbi:HD-GYP domain-containing protein [Paenibacillus contaminans]|uniref:HD-GYP domain-containing protein n=1 Tax=Paenibacillus contaminans TaxID=450362 RepID=A0A329M6E8_9BACL|nr:HD-GYP domain-containing protein [Paenibacillus contaminans]RAV15524.1 HD-GYP domain-containing protein [Paenibacillus contaminans]
MNQSLIGRRLKHDIVNDFGAVLIAAETQLKPEHWQKLIQHRVEVSPYDLYPEEQETPATSEAAQQEAIVEQATERIRNIFEEIRDKQIIPVHDIHEHVIPSLESATQNYRDLFVLLTNLQSKDDYTYRHNIGVGVLSALLGKWLNLSERDQSQLMIAATLYDVGKMLIPESILNKKGKLTAEEFDLLKTHTVRGHDLIRACPGTTEEMARVALEHHERNDGSGYPYGKKGEDTHLFSKIVAVADVFHAMISDRPYHHAIPFHEALDQLRKDAFGKLDSTVVFALLNNIMKQFVGSKVILTDGSEAEVVLVHPDDPFNPLVKTISAFIDLKKLPDLKISRVLGFAAGL